MTRPIEELLPERPEARLRIYAWSTSDIPKYAGCLKVGQTTQDVNHPHQAVARPGEVRTTSWKSTSRPTVTTERSSETTRCVSD